MNQVCNNIKTSFSLWYDNTDNNIGYKKVVRAQLESFKNVSL